MRRRKYRKESSPCCTAVRHFGLRTAFHILILVYDPHGSFYVLLPHKTFVKRQIVADSVLSEEKKIITSLSNNQRLRSASTVLDPRLSFAPACYISQIRVLSCPAKNIASICIRSAFFYIERNDDFTMGLSRFKYSHKEFVKRKLTQTPSYLPSGGISSKISELVYEPRIDFVQCKLLIGWV